MVFYGGGKEDDVQRTVISSSNKMLSKNIYILFGTVVMIMLFVERSIHWSSMSRPFAIPPLHNAINTSVARLGFCIQCFTLKYCQGIAGGILTYIKKFLKLKIFILNFATFFCVFAISISFFSWSLSYKWSLTCLLLNDRWWIIVQDSPYRFHAIPKPSLRMRVWWLRKLRIIILRNISYT